MTALALLEYSQSWNLGDEIQTLAVRQHINGFDRYVDRDHLDEVVGSEVVVVMQGWFAKRSATMLPSSSIRPVWIGFHLSWHCAELLDRREIRRVLQSSGPVGCRDEVTAELLQSRGVDAWVSGCMTTTFPRREVEPAVESVYLVDTAGVPLPDRFQGSASHRVTHQGAPWWSQDSKRSLASDLLREYREKATLVVTTRLHCALPCLAMGIPVVFIGDPEDRRLEPVEGLVEVIPFPRSLRNEAISSRLRRRGRWIREMRDLPWTGRCKDIEQEKMLLVRRFREGLRNAGIDTLDKMG